MPQNPCVVCCSELNVGVTWATAKPFPQHHLAQIGISNTVTFICIDYKFALTIAQACSYES
jgi:hypothetical protein